MWNLLSGTLDTAAIVLLSTAVLLALFVGFCVLLNLPKLRSSGGSSRVVRSLDEALGQRESYLPPDAPRGPADQLRTPELLETQRVDQLRDAESPGLPHA
jgi:hypothetical protein